MKLIEDTCRNYFNAVVATDMKSELMKDVSQDKVKVKLSLCLTKFHAMKMY
jgi:hypothetical protein